VLSIIDESNAIREAVTAATAYLFNSVLENKPATTAWAFSFSR